MNRGLRPMRRKAMSVLVNWLNTSLALLLMGLTVLSTTSVSAADIKAWEASVNSQTKERYIPVELWAGTDWDGKFELKMPPVDGTIVTAQRPTTSKGRRSGNTQSLDRHHSSTKESIRVKTKTTTNRNCSPLIKTKRVWAGYSTAGRVETREPIRAV
jgi:hypothetical protein